MRYWNDQLLKTKMFISYSVVSLFIVGITCGIFYYKNTSDIKDQTFSLSKIISKQFSEMIDLYIQNIEELSLAISIDPSIQGILFDFYKATDPVEKEVVGYKLNPILFNFSYPKAYVQRISIYSLDNHLYQYSKRVEPSPRNQLTPEQLSALTVSLSKKPFVSLPSYEINTDEQHAEKGISFIRKITKIPTQTIIGFAQIDINVNAFNMVLANTNANEMQHTMNVLMVNDEGRIIYENGSDAPESAQDMFEPGVLSRNDTEGELNWRHTEYLYTVVKSGYTGWNTVILIPKDVLLQKQKRIQDIVLLVGVLTMLLIAAVSYLLSHQILRPLNNLMRNMSRVELGDFSHRMDYSGRNEIGKLSRMYNHMLESISRLIHEVYESKLAEKHAQLSALHAQINPHFLYNTLNIMKSISRLRGIEEVAEISESLAGLFQYSMKNMQHPVRLQEEIEHIYNYFNIQQHRFGSRVQLCCDIPPELLEARILKLTVQPLIENAFNHGLRRTKSGGCITLRAAEAQGMLTITVHDNGEGISAKTLAQLQKAFQMSNALNFYENAGHGIGLLNIRQRIQLYYGKEYGLTVASKPGEGTSVSLVLPFVTEVKESRKAEEAAL
ncbi:sensor histidine kinase [Paenibacillus sp. OAS669]|uniref:cache domain-containing sensor histidine kinase n=1 Tax=Paenibacillus sp. OAS669 TaxID=2663821 RepID=UPI0017898B4C|nr:sensor histidine kinase [Paenibacillus sp. OAS669]MBE1442519.1 sensor histidine kinase YesM [Paenibacillus sp. OAS669]